VDDDTTGDDDTTAGPFTGAVATGPQVFSTSSVDYVSVASFGLTDPAGRAAVIYQDQHDSMIGKVVAYDHDGALAWSPQALAESSGAAVAIASSAAATLTNGNVAVAFQEHGSLDARFVVFDRDGTRLGAPEGQMITIQALPFAVAGAANGDLMVAYYAASGPRLARITPGGSGPPVADFLINSTAVVLDMSVTTLHGGSHAAVVWVEQHGPSNNQAWYAIYDTDGSSSPLAGGFVSEGSGESVAIAAFDDNRFLVTFGSSALPGSFGIGPAVYYVIQHDEGWTFANPIWWEEFAAGTWPSELSATRTHDGQVMVVYKESTDTGKLLVITPDNGPTMGATFQSPNGITRQTSCAELSTGEAIIGYADNPGAAPFNGKFVIVN